MRQQIIRTNNIEEDLTLFINGLQYNGLFILCDENTEKYCFPKIQFIPVIQSAKKIVIPAGDEKKNIETLCKVWKFLSENGANRKSLLINLGGGMLTDLGGFAAATFKRGIQFINIPTTLLGAVDAAVGGKTGINFNGLKNEIGNFAPAIAIFMDAGFFISLDRQNLLSGYAEMLKHVLLNSSQNLNQLFSFDLDDVDYEELNELLFESVLVKEKIVEEDPEEQGIRKALNLGHTFGHAFESLSYELKNPVAHGYAVAWGIVCELYLSFIKLNFDKNDLAKVVRFVKENYGTFPLDCTQYARIHDLMRHDKKNESSEINFTLLKSVGDVAINQSVSEEEMDETLDFFQNIFS